MKHLLLVGLLSGLCSFALAAAPEREMPAAGPAHHTAVPGGVYRWQPPAGAQDIRFNGQPVLQVGDHIIVGISIKTEPGTASLSYRQGDARVQHEFQVHPKTYTEQHLTIENQDMVTPPEKVLARIREESRQQRALYRNYAPEHHLHQGFILPLHGITTSLFGHRRFFNGQPRSPHSGLDIAADTGTPIVAAAAGKVTLAQPLYYNGNTVFIDHGQGLITMYCHMSELHKAVGEPVAQGESIGLVGATGRVTGPHLHWSVSLGGVRIDPQTFMQVLGELQPGSAD